MMFSDKQLKQLIIPLLVEQILAVTVGLADSVMIAGLEKQPYQAYLWWIR